MRFINRHKEMERLNHVASLPEGGVVVVWGRRRVGKTRLLLEWAQEHAGIYYTADESAPVLQRKYFAMALEKALPGFASVEYADWEILLTRLAKEALQVGWRGPLIIDELPYLISMSPEFPSILQKFIDREAKKAKLIIALCGSSQRMMQGAILDASSPLYGRAHEMIKLSPISAGYIGEALGLSSPLNMVESYSVWGGIPRYWELVNNQKEGSLWEHIDRLVLDPMGPLNDEPNRLLLEEIPPAITLRPILDAIGLGAHRLSEIATRIGQPVTSLTRAIQRLIELDLIIREVPFGEQEHNSKRTLYKMKDAFMRFWFDLVASRRSYLAQSFPEQRQKWLMQNFQPIVSKTWEDLCRSVIPSLTQSWHLPFIGQAGRYWHGQGPKWDILAQSMDGEILLIGETKWTSKTPTKTWIENTIKQMKAKGIPPLSKQEYSKFIYTLFIPEKPTQLNLPQDCRVVDAKEVMHLLKN